MMDGPGGQVLDILTPTRKKLTSLEAERVATVIDDLIQKIELLQVAFFSDTRRDGDLALPGPVQVALDQYRKSEADFLKSEDSSATEAVQDATRSLARSLQTYPEQAEAAVESVRTATADEDMVAVRAQSIDLFLEQLQDLRDVLFEKLLTTVDEERGRQEHLAKLVANQKSLKKEIAELSKTKEQHEAERDALVQQRTDVIQKITSELYRITSQGDAVYSRVTEQGAKSEADKKAAADSQIEVLTAEADSLEKKLAAMLQEHADEEGKIRKSKFKLEADVAGWISKYDEEMTRKQELIDVETEAHTTEKAQMEELQKKFDTLKDEYDAIMEEKRIARERYDAHHKELAEKNRAASIIQKRWSSFQEEKKAAKGKKKGSKKKGSKKKGSKKKKK